MLKVKSGQNWLKVGDCNSRFFHNTLKERLHRNSFSVLNSSNGIIEGVMEIKSFARNHFENNFKEPMNRCHIPEGISFNYLENGVVCRMDCTFEEEEIKQGIWSCDGEKTPGLDGYSMTFFKQHWEILKDDVMKFVEYFHSKAVLTKACTTTFISLIPKVKNPQSLLEYRPICLVSSMHKILSKLLATRMKEVCNSLISTNQNAFIKSRSIMNGVFMVNEIIHLVKRDGSSCLALKVDFKKAYDCVCWDFLRCVMKKMGFGIRLLS